MVYTETAEGLQRPLTEGKPLLIGVFSGVTVICHALEIRATATGHQK